MVNGQQLTPTQMRRAQVLTPEAQMREFGRVVTPQPTTQQFVEEREVTTEQPQRIETGFTESRITPQAERTRDVSTIFRQQEMISRGETPTQFRRFAPTASVSTAQLGISRFQAQEKLKKETEELELATKGFPIKEGKILVPEEQFSEIEKEAKDVRQAQSEVIKLQAITPTPSRKKESFFRVFRETPTTISTRISESLKKPAEISKKISPESKLSKAFGRISERTELVSAGIVKVGEKDSLVSVPAKIKLGEVAAATGIAAGGTFAPIFTGKLVGISLVGSAGAAGGTKIGELVSAKEERTIFKVRKPEAIEVSSLVRQQDIQRSGFLGQLVKQLPGGPLLTEIDVRKTLEKTKEKPLVNLLIGIPSVTPRFVRKKETFFGIETRKELERRGFTPSEAVATTSVLERRRVGGEIGGLVSILGINVATEIGGTASVAKSFLKRPVAVELPKAGITTFKRTFPSIFKEGAIEAFASEISTATAREIDVKPTALAVETGVGAVSAGLIGGSVAGLSAAGKGIKAKALLTGARTLDPFEAPGDIIADIIREPASKALRIPVLTPTIIKGKGGVILTTDIQPTFRRTKAKPTPKPRGKPTTPGVTPTTTLSKTPGIVPSIVSILTPSTTPTAITTTTTVPVTTSVSIPTLIPTSIPSTIPTSLPITTPISISTAISTPTPTTVPVSTPVPVVVPRPLFPFIPGFSGGGGARARRGFRRKGKRKTRKLPSLIGILEGIKEVKGAPIKIPTGFGVRAIPINVSGLLRGKGGIAF